MMCVNEKIEYFIGSFFLYSLISEINSFYGILSLVILSIFYGKDIAYIFYILMWTTHELIYNVSHSIILLAISLGNTPWVVWFYPLVILFSLSYPHRGISMFELTTLSFFCLLLSTLLSFYLFTKDYLNMGILALAIFSTFYLTVRRWQL